MTSALLDANLLIALVWPSHEHHDRAHTWFEGRGQKRWATCPLTELAFVRIVSNPMFSPDALKPVDALALLERNLSHPRHERWADDLGVVEAVGQIAAPLQGHRQLTDAYLLALARRRGGVLVSFDSGLRSLARGPLAGSLELIPVGPAKRQKH